MKFCHKCGVEYPEGEVTFCPECGASALKKSSGFGSKTIHSSTRPSEPRVTRKDRTGIPLWVAWLVVGLLAAGNLAQGLYFGVFADRPGADDGGTAAGTTSTVSGGDEPISLGAVEAKWPDDSSLIQTESWGEVPANQVLVLMTEGSTRTDADRVAQELGGAVVGWMEYISLYQIETTGTTEAELTAALEQAEAIAGVEVAAPNSQLELSDIQGTRETPLDDSIYRGDGGRASQMVNLQRGWDVLAGARALGVGGNKVVEGVVDTALYTGTDDLNIVTQGQTGKQGVATIRAADSSALTSSPAVDDSGQVVDGGWNHSNFVAQVGCADHTDGGPAGFFAPLGSNIEVVCVNWRSAKYYQEVASPDPNDPTLLKYGSKSYAMNALVKMQEAVDKGATVINCSFNSTKTTDANEPEVKCYKAFLEKLAIEHPEVLVVASAGNNLAGVDGKNDIWGQNLPNLVTVSALDNKYDKASFSNYAVEGGVVDIAAPGVNLVFGRDQNQELIVNSGTSFAAPQVAATAVLIRSLFPDLTASEIKDILKTSAADEVTGLDGVQKWIPPELGTGCLRVDAALYEAIKRKMGATAPSLEELLALGRLDLSADGGPLDFTVTASVGAVPKGGSTTLRIEIMGQGSIGGLTEQTLTAPGEISWNVTKINISDDAFIRVTRLDSGASATLSLTSSPAGMYVGKLDLSTTLPGYDETISGTADLTITVDESGATVFEFSGTDTYDVALGGGMSVTETVTVSGRFIGTAVDGAVEASGTVDIDTSISGAVNATVPQSYQATATGSLSDGSLLSGTIELQGVTVPYTATWSASKQ